MTIIEIPVPHYVVYVLCVNDPEFDYYIGSSSDLWSRLSAHQKIKGGSNYPFWHVLIIECPSKEYMTQLEDFLMREYRKAGRRLANRNRRRTTAVRHLNP